MREIVLPSRDKNISISEAEYVALTNRSRAGRKRRAVEQAVDLPGEIWGTIPQTAEYFYSNLGRVKREYELRNGQIRSVLIKPSIYNNNYSVCVILQNNYKVRTNIARLVLMAFKPCKDQEYLFPVNLDGDRSNNRIENLKWLTRAERKEYLVTNNQRKPNLKVKQYLDKRGKLRYRKVAFSDIDIKKIYQLHELGYSQSFIANEIGSSQQYISKVLSNKIHHVQ
jgi:hypothetical protein